jgi:hypothetical protein
VSRLLDIERAAFARMGQRRGALVLGAACALTGALALEAALARAALALHAGTSAQLRLSLAAAGLGFDLLLVLASLGLGLSLAAIARPLAGAGLFLPAARTSAGIFSVGRLAFIVAYASTLGLLRLAGMLGVRLGHGTSFALAMALASTPTLLLVVILGPSAAAAMALVARGVPPGQAVAVGIDHVLRRPGQALALLALHAAVAAVLLVVALVIVGDRLRLLPALAPLGSLSLAWTIAVFDAAIGADPKLISG